MICRFAGDLDTSVVMYTVITVNETLIKDRKKCGSSSRISGFPGFRTGQQFFNRHHTEVFYYEKEFN